MPAVLHLVDTQVPTPLVPTPYLYPASSPLLLPPSAARTLRLSGCWVGCRVGVVKCAEKPCNTSSCWPQT